MRGRISGNRMLTAASLATRTLIVIFMLVPAVAILVMSFSNDQQLAFPPTSWGVAQYYGFAISDVWKGALWKSFQVALPACLIALLIGLPAVIALNRSRLPLKGVVTGLGLAPLVLPGVAYAVAMYTLTVRLGILGNFWTLVLADAMLVVPFVIVVLTAAIARVPRELELVAMSLGASRSRAVLGVTVRLLLPGIVAAGVLAFITNFDEAVFVNFIAGPELVTLPKAIFESLRTGLDPVITAIAAVLMLLTAGSMLIVSLLTRDRTHSSPPTGHQAPSRRQ
jgi:ABC-type spermidine/putrescine transport system permease subunit II